MQTTPTVTSTESIDHKCPHCAYTNPNEFAIKVHLGMRHKNLSATTIKKLRKEKRTAYQLAIIKRFMSPAQFAQFNEAYETAMKSTPRMDKRAKEIIKYMKQNRNMTMLAIASHFKMSEYNLMKIVTGAVTGR